MLAGVFRISGLIRRNPHGSLHKRQTPCPRAVARGKVWIFGLLDAAGLGWAVYGYQAEPLTKDTFTARDAAAPGFGDVLTLTTPRTDDVLDVVTVPVASGPAPAAAAPSHLESVRAELIGRQLPAGQSPDTRPPAPLSA